MKDGIAVGKNVGASVGVGVGVDVGSAVGAGVGEADGNGVGEKVGPLVYPTGSHPFVCTHEAHSPLISMKFEQQAACAAGQTVQEAEAHDSAPAESVGEEVGDGDGAGVGLKVGDGDGAGEGDGVGDGEVPALMHPKLCTHCSHLACPCA